MLNVSERVRKKYRSRGGVCVVQTKMANSVNELQKA